MQAIEIRTDRYAYVFGPYAEPIARVRPGDLLDIYCEDAFESRVQTTSDLPSRVVNFPFVNPQAGPIYGDDYPTPDGTAVRDYVHVVDVAEAHLRAVRYLAEDGVSRAFNLGSGKGASVREVLAAVEAVAGCRVPTRISPRRPGDPPMLIASSEEARRVLGWKPRFEGLDTILETAWDWRSRHPEGYAE